MFTLIILCCYVVAKIEMTRYKMQSVAFFADLILRLLFKIHQASANPFLVFVVTNANHFPFA